MLGDRYLDALQRHRRLRRLLYGFVGVLKRILFAMLLLVRNRRYDIVIVEQEFLPLCFWRSELWFLKKIIRGSLVVDIDDANYLRVCHFRKGSYALSPRRKNVEIWRLSSRVVCGSDLIHEDVSRALGSDSKCFLIPSSSDPVECSDSKIDDEPRYMRIGWIGSPSTSVDLMELVGPLNELITSFQFEFVVVGSLDHIGGNFPTKLSRWTPEIELQTLNSIRIGVMPVADDVFRQRKCGYKIVQYFSAGVPAVVSNVGGNRQIVQRDGLMGGFVVSSKEEWIEVLTGLLSDEEKYRQVSRDAREIHRRFYSLESASKSWRQLLHDLQVV